MKCIKKILPIFALFLLIPCLHAVKLKYFIESSSIHEALEKQNSIILKEKYDSLQLNAINNFELDISAREDFFMEIKPGYHDIKVDYLNGNLRRGWFKGNQLTKRYYFKPGQIYLLSSERFRNRWLLYLKKIDLEKNEQKKLPVIKKLRRLYENGVTAYRGFKALESVVSKKA